MSPSRLCSHHVLCRVLGTEESAWGEDDEAGEHDYYNSIPGKEPPPGGLVDSRLRHGTLLGHVRIQPPSSSPASQVSFGAAAGPAVRGQG